MPFDETASNAACLIKVSGPILIPTMRAAVERGGETEVVRS